MTPVVTRSPRCGEGTQSVLPAVPWPIGSWRGHWRAQVLSLSHRTCGQPRVPGLCSRCEQTDRASRGFLSPLTGDVWAASLREPMGPRGRCCWSDQWTGGTRTEGQQSHTEADSAAWPQRSVSEVTLGCVAVSSGSAHTCVPAHALWTLVLSEDVRLTTFAPTVMLPVTGGTLGYDRFCAVTRSLPSIVCDLAHTQLPVGLEGRSDVWFEQHAVTESRTVGKRPPEP